MTGFLVNIGILSVSIGHGLSTMHPKKSAAANNQQLKHRQEMPTH